LPNWIWPRQLNPRTSGAVRLGRVLHWMFVILSAPWLAACVAPFLEPDMTDRVGFFLLFLSAALLTSLVGRGLRYIFANE